MCAASVAKPSLFGDLWLRAMELDEGGYLSNLIAWLFRKTKEPKLLSLQAMRALSRYSQSWSTLSQLHITNPVLLCLLRIAVCPMLYSEVGMVNSFDFGSALEDWPGDYEYRKADVTRMVERSKVREEYKAYFHLPRALSWLNSITFHMAFQLTETEHLTRHIEWVMDRRAIEMAWRDMYVSGAIRRLSQKRQQVDLLWEIVNALAKQIYKEQMRLYLLHFNHASREEFIMKLIDSEKYLVKSSFFYWLDKTADQGPFWGWTIKYFFTRQFSNGTTCHLRW